MNSSDFRKNKYTIGIHIIEGKDTPKEVDGIYAFGGFGLAYIATSPERLCDDIANKIYIIEGYQEAQKLAQYLARTYRTEFRHNAIKANADMSNYRFYPIKLTKPYFDNFEFQWETASDIKEKEKYWGNKHGEVKRVHLELKRPEVSPSVKTE